MGKKSRHIVICLSLYMQFVHDEEEWYTLYAITLDHIIIYIHIHRSMKQRVVLMRVPKVKLNFCYVWTAATAIPSISPANICHCHQLIGGRAKPTRNSVQPYCNDPQTRNNAFPTKADSALATGVYLYAGTYLPINLPNLCRASVQSHLSTFTIRDSSQATNYIYYT